MSPSCSAIWQSNNSDLSYNISKARQITGLFAYENGLYCALSQPWDRHFLDMPFKLCRKKSNKRFCLLLFSLLCDDFADRIRNVILCKICLQMGRIVDLLRAVLVDVGSKETDPLQRLKLR